MNDRFTNVFVKPFCKWTRKRYIISLLVKKKKIVFIRIFVCTRFISSKFWQSARATLRRYFTIYTLPPCVRATLDEEVRTR